MDIPSSPSGEMHRLGPLATSALMTVKLNSLGFSRSFVAAESGQRHETAQRRSLAAC